MEIQSRIIQFAAKLDLGRKYNSPSLCGSESGKTEVYYPSLWVDGKPDPIDLPDKGKAIVEYRVTRRATEERDGKKRHDATIEIQSMEPMGAKDGKKKLPGSAVTIKRVGFSGTRAGMIQLSRKPVDVFNFDRVRDGDGQFVPQAAEGGPDANTMTAAYGHPAQRAQRAQQIHVGGKAAAAMGSGAAAVLLAQRLRARMRK